MPFAECFLSPLQCGFRKGYSTQHALLKVLETCKATIDRGGFADALLMDLSKAFDMLKVWIANMKRDYFVWKLAFKCLLSMFYITIVFQIS